MTPLAKAGLLCPTRFTARARPLRGLCRERPMEHQATGRPKVLASPRDVSHHMLVWSCRSSIHWLLVLSRALEHRTGAAISSGWADRWRSQTGSQMRHTASVLWRTPGAAPRCSRTGLYRMFGPQHLNQERVGSLWGFLRPSGVLAQAEPKLVTRGRHAGLRAALARPPWRNDTRRRGQKTVPSDDESGLDPGPCHEISTCFRNRRRLSRSDLISYP